MYENPLLPNRKLQELYALMQRARKLGRQPAGTTRLEAMLAASLIQVEPGDYVSPPVGEPAAEVIAAEYTSRKETTALRLPAHQRLATVAGIAQGLLLGKDSRVAVFYTDVGSASARTDQGWAEALTYSARARLPLIVICADIATPRPRKTAGGGFTFDTITLLARKLKFPVLTVDGSDAVAVYRVMQESILRARTLSGTAVIWCLLPQPGTAAADPIAHMRRYLTDRELLPVSVKSAKPKSRKA